jgi:hypothetical protein
VRFNRVFFFLYAFLLAPQLLAQSAPPVDTPPETLHSLPGFFRFSFDNQVNMPSPIPAMGLLGFDYFAEVTPLIYAGFGGYGSIAGTQGGLFTVGIEGGLHRELLPHWWADAGVFVGGGGGKSSLTGGGLMLRPHAGVAYQFPRARLGIFYSYIDFPSGFIRSQQVGLNLDLPVDLSYLSPHDSLVGSMIDLDDIRASVDRFIGFQHNDFSILLQAYQQKSGTKNTADEIQDETMGLVGAELDHYLTDHLFWSLKTSGAFSGSHNGYMDVLGGIGYHLSLGQTPFALVPQVGLGAGGGGMVDTGGGFLVNPSLGLEWAATPAVSMRVSSGYLWAPDGDFQVVPVTGELIWHLDVATESWHPTQWLSEKAVIQGWRFQTLNQTYFHPQRTFDNTTSSIELIGVQVDQLFTPWFFFSYQAMGAYSGYHAGGYATGMIGPGIQTPDLFHQPIQLFGTLFVGAGGGGGLALSGGALVEPVIGVRYAITPLLGIQASMGEIKAIRDDLNTPVFNIGLTMRFDTLNQSNRASKNAV